MAGVGRRHGSRAVIGVAAATLVLAGCTGVPTSSTPQVVTPVGVGRPSGSLGITPAPGADPRTIVTDFLTANAASDDPHHNAARSFLTREAKQRWADTTATVVGSLQVGNVTANSLTVTAHKLGAIGPSGIYSPVLEGNGLSGTVVTFSFQLKKVAGQWRIETLQNGVILAYDEFQRIYQQRSVYFFDLAEKRVVPDPRYSPLQDPSLLASWLIGQLAAGPRPELQSAVSNELPAPTDPARVTVTLGTAVKINVPGAAQLDPQTRDRLAAQVALTLQDVARGSDISIIDGGRAVVIPQVSSDRFTTIGFESAIQPVNSAPALFYVRGGAVVDQVGRPLHGDLGTGRYALTSVALGTTGSADLRVAGTTGPLGNAKLLVGTRDGGLHATSVRGRLSRPAWVPGLPEVWIGDGRIVYRVGLDGKARAVALTAATGALIGRVTALRLSPEGTRIAIVSTSADGKGQLLIGAVVRNSDSSQVRVDDLEPISPPGVSVTDVAWNDLLKLFTIGHDVTTGEAGVYEVQVDGSLWTPRGTGNLPQAPDSITIAENEVAWVSTGGTVWSQQASAWSSQGPQNVFCTDPVYVE